MYSCHDCKCCPVRLISCRQHATKGIYWTRQRKNSPDPTISFHVCFRVFNCVTLLFLTVTKNDYYLAVVALWQPLDSFSTWANGHCFSLMLLFHREHRPSVCIISLCYPLLGQLNHHVPLHLFAPSVWSIFRRTPILQPRPPGHVSCTLPSEPCILSSCLMFIQNASSLTTYLPPPPPAIYLSIYLYIYICIYI